MSKIGKLPITLKEGVTVAVANNAAIVTGPKGTLTFSILAGITVAIADGRVQVGQEMATRDTTRDIFGLTRAILSNMVTGVSTGIEKKLELTGVGYRAQA